MEVTQHVVRTRGQYSTVSNCQASSHMLPSFTAVVCLTIFMADFKANESSICHYNLWLQRVTNTTGHDDLRIVTTTVPSVHWSTGGNDAADEWMPDCMILQTGRHATKYLVAVRCQHHSHCRLHCIATRTGVKSTKHCIATRTGVKSTNINSSAIGSAWARTRLAADGIILANLDWHNVHEMITERYCRIQTEHVSSVVAGCADVLTDCRQNQIQVQDCEWLRSKMTRLVEANNCHHAAFDMLKAICSE